MVKNIEHVDLAGERPLSFCQDIFLRGVNVTGGEDALLECENVEAHDCTFSGTHALWHNIHAKIYHSRFTESAVSSIWYDDDIAFARNQVESPRIFRHAYNLDIDDCVFSNSSEDFWSCSHVNIKNCTFEQAGYLFFRSDNVDGENLEIRGDSSFQYVLNVTLHNCRISGEEALWEAQNVKVYDSVLEGDCLGWHSSRLHLINCKIKGRQPLCYCQNLIIEDCSFDEDCVNAFEYSSLIANISNRIPSVRNPLQGLISAQDYGEIIQDRNDRSDGKCMIKKSGI